MINKNIQITNDSIVSIDNSISIVDIDGEIGMMNLNRNSYYSINSVGGRIWKIIETPKKVSEIVEILVGEYDIDYKICTEEVIKFLYELESEELLIRG